MTACTTWRRVVHGGYKLSLATGERLPLPDRVVTERCYVPLFTAAELDRGTCDSCASGWSVEGNRPATAEEIADVESRQVVHHAQ